MNFLALALGILVPALIGWCAVNLVEYQSSVLTGTERTGWSLILGPTLTMLIAFLLAAAGITDFSVAGFLIPTVGLLLLLALTASKLGCLFPPDHTVSSATEPRGWQRIGILLLAVWTALKLLAGAYDLVSVPTYWDDSFNNWNMRGKIFYATRLPVLEIPVGNGVVQTAQGVSSYPPALPLMKTWVSVIRGSWQEPVVNGVQLIWVAGLLIVFYGFLRRRFGVLHSLFGVSVLVSLPLVLIQSMNPYAEIFVAAHLLITVSALFLLADARDARSASGLLRLFAFSLGLLLFTKNEATVIYAPVLVVLALIVLVPLVKRGVLTGASVRKHGLLALGLLLLLALPWFAFKWTHGLTFGNAKAVSGVTIEFSGRALWAIWHHLSHEPNELFLPLLLPLTLIAAGRKAFRLPVAVLSLFVIATVGMQLVLFVFVKALETEAVMQTGISRGLIQIAPLGVLLLMLLGKDLLKNEA